SIADTGLTETRYIKAIQTRPGPGTLKVIHHVTSQIRQQVEDTEKLTGTTGNAEEQALSEYSVRKGAEFMPEGSGIIIKPGSKIKFQAHYHSIGKEIVDTHSELGFVFYPKGVVPKYLQKRSAVGMPVYGNING